MKSWMILGASLALMAFTFPNAGSGDCNGYAMMEKGVTLVYQDYNAKDKLVGTHQSTVTELSESDGAVKATVHSVSKDDKDKVTNEGDYGFTCKDGVISIDMRSVAGSSMDAYKDMEVTLDQSDLVFPATLTEGQTLPDGTMTMKVSSGGMVIMTMVTQIVDRKVEAFESVTTAAGTFECAKISQVMNMDMGMMKTTSKQVSWFTSGVGMVRSESYNKNGELQSYTVLSQIQR